MSKAQSSDPGSSDTEQNDVYDQLRNHDKVEKVKTFADGTAMVILDWVTDSTTKNGTRYIHEKNYDGHILDVTAFIDELDGVTKTRGNKTGLASYTIHIELTDA